MRMGGAHFFGHRKMREDGEWGTDEPAWNDVLSKIRPPTRPEALRDLELMRRLFDFFPDQVNRLHCDGRSSLHVAVMRGHVEIVKELLVQRHVDVNQELDTGEAGSLRCVPHVMKGRTALDILVLTDSRLPAETNRGGPAVKRRWKEDISTIGQLLTDAGARSGSTADSSTFWRGISFDHIFISTLFNFHFGMTRGPPVRPPARPPTGHTSCRKTTAVSSRPVLIISEKCRAL